MRATASTPENLFFWWNVLRIYHECVAQDNKNNCAGANIVIEETSILKAPRLALDDDTIYLADYFQSRSLF